MQALMRHKLKLCNSTFNFFFKLSSTSSSSYFHSYSSPLNSSLPSSTSVSAHSSAINSFTTPWSTIQRRGNRVHASDIRVGNTIGKQGRIYEVLKVDHSHEGRGKATIKMYIGFYTELA
ncbi:elongation factor p-like protein [Trifolium pratense]|uniref:Elongation factor p-like protein n=1 Tax=Trifolium pratense TaxID=57577 RepID=A0A2K3P1R0_TRIPR|nr:elongation factor p-like protein [Trifolium pratense]